MLAALIKLVLCHRPNAADIEQGLTDRSTKTRSPQMLSCVVPFSRK